MEIKITIVKKKKTLKCGLTAVRRLGEEGQLGRIRGEVRLAGLLVKWPRKQGKEVMHWFQPLPPKIFCWSNINWRRHK